MNREDRARQFMPFASLRGYYDLIRERERVTSPRRELSEDEAQELDGKLRALRRGTMAKITWYRDGAYETMEGMVSAIDLITGSITLIKTKIPIADITDAEQK